MDVVREMYCETCAAVTPFEACPAMPSSTAPRMHEDHEDGAEWACTRCGEAIVLAPLSPTAA